MPRKNTFDSVPYIQMKYTKSNDGIRIKNGGEEIGDKSSDENSSPSPN